jgi:hypothetical protein
MIRFSDLTPEQEAFICNGCGGKGGWVPVPEFFCHASCDRKDADHDFLVEMLKDAGDDPTKQTIALTYWMAVRLFGAFYFHYSDREQDEYDLARAMGVKICPPILKIVQTT